MFWRNTLPFFGWHLIVFSRTVELYFEFFGNQHLKCFMVKSLLFICKPLLSCYAKMRILINENHSLLVNHSFTNKANQNKFRNWKIFHFLKLGSIRY